MRRRPLLLLCAAGVLLTAVVGAAFSLDGLRNRLTIVGHKAAGRLTDVSWADLFYLLDPRSGIWLEPLAKHSNPYASIAGPESTDQDRQQGQQLYSSRCAACHARDGRGGSGPALVGRRFQHGNSDWALYRTIRLGVPGTAMMAHAIALCRERGCYKVVISSNFKRPKAHAFYESLGFERHGYSFRLTL